jgi:hypothetical protein
MSYIVAEELVKKYGKGEATVTAVSEVNPAPVNPPCFP